MEQVKRNLLDTIVILRRSLSRLLERGQQIDQLSDTSTRLLSSSEEFFIRVAPWYVRCYQFFCVCPRWWFLPTQQVLEPLPHRRVII